MDERKKDKSRVLSIYVGLSYRVNGRTITDNGKIKWGGENQELSIGYILTEMPTRYSCSDFKKEVGYKNLELGRVVCDKEK